MARVNEMPTDGLPAFEWNGRPLPASEREGRDDMRHETRKISRSPADKARLKAIRERFQKQKPTLEELAESGEFGPPIPTAMYFAIAPVLKKLRIERIAADISLAELAERTGMDKATLSRLETGTHENPTIATLTRYATALGKQLTFGVADLPADSLVRVKGRKVPAGE
jgi:DNA-binding Xre family transcriptional regulator